jgi:hypothetical protein
VQREAQVTGCPLDDSDGTALAAGQATVGLALAVPGGNRVHEDAQDLAKEFAIRRQRKTQRKWHC